MQRVLSGRWLHGRADTTSFVGGYHSTTTPPFLALPPPPPSQDFDPLDYDGEKAKKAMKVKKAMKADAEKAMTKAQKAAKEK